MKKHIVSTKRRRSVQARPARKKPLIDHILEALRNNVLFTNVNPKSVRLIVPKLTIRDYKAGDVIFDEATRGHELYLIASGKVRIKKITQYGAESLLSILHANDFFGELAIIDGLPLGARAEAMEDSTIMSMHSSDFRALLGESPTFTANVAKDLAIRLRTMDQTFVLELERYARVAKNELDKLNLLIEASKIVNSTIHIDKLLGLILEAAVRSIKADRGTLYLVDSKTNELWSMIAQGQNMVEIRLQIGKGLAGYVGKTGETVNITDAYKDPRFNPEIDKKSGYKTRNVLCMAMRDKERKIVGVFQFLNKKNGSFTSDDEGFIDALSVHAAIAVENARLAQEMVKSESLSAVGRMASTIIHDIKNPMGTLRLYAQMIKKKSGNEESSKLAEEIIRQVDRFVNMTQEILDFSRGVSEMNVETAQFEEVMESVLKFIENDLVKRNVTLERKLDYAGPCRMDVEKMVRVFYNLASNAADAMPNGGTLTVQAGKTDDGKLRISFTDTGTGMPEEVRSKIFEAFFTHGKKHGTGLGLSIVKKIIDDHKGNIGVESEVGKGTTFRITLPLT
jgi:K+-sensing histidine kinase KdpD